MHHAKPLLREFTSLIATSRLLQFTLVTTVIIGTAAGAESISGKRGAQPEKSSFAESGGKGQKSGGTNRDGAELIRSKGAFAELWNEQFFIGPGLLAPSRPDQTGSKLRLPGDFEKHEKIVLPGGWLAREAPDILCDIVTKVSSSCPVVLLVSSLRERDFTIRTLAERALSPDAVEFFVVPTNTPWVRDFGPLFVFRRNGERSAVDAAYDNPGRDLDDAAARTIAAHFRINATNTPLRWQGGNILSNGQGLLVTTTQSINANIEAGYDVEVSARFLARHFGAEQVVVLEHLMGETTGHVDMYACFTASNTVMVGDCDEAADPHNAALLDRNAARLEDVRTTKGKLEVIRIPMPGNRDGVWRSFANVVFANGVLLVPTYPDVAESEGVRALATYRRLLPNWKVFGVDSSSIAQHQGGLRCVTLYVPYANGEP